MKQYILLITYDFYKTYGTKSFTIKENAIRYLNEQINRDIKAIKQKENFTPDIIRTSETEAIIMKNRMITKALYRILEVDIEELDKYKDLEAMVGIPFETMVELCNRIVPENCKYPKKTRTLTDETVDEWDRYKNNRDNGLLFVLPYDIRKVKTLYYLDYDGKIYEVPKANTLTISVDDDEKITYTIRHFTFTEEEMKERVFTTLEEAKEKQKKMF